MAEIKQPTEYRGSNRIYIYICLVISHITSQVDWGKGWSVLVILLQKLSENSQPKHSNIFIR